jgi:hypothetical protein
MRADFSDYKFRCSSLGKLMTNPPGNGKGLSKTTKTYLNEIHKEEVFGRTNEITSRYLDKGIQVEEEAIEMYNRVYGTSLEKNDEFFENDFICGTPDIVSPLIDIKSSWSFSSFPMNDTELQNKDYKWQLIGYMILTGATESEIAYCLVNTPQMLIEDELRRLSWKLGMIDIPMDLELETYKNLQYDDIPENIRIKRFKTLLEEKDTEALYERIKLCRGYLNELSEGLANTFKI